MPKVRPTFRDVPPWLMYAVIISLVVSWVPLAFIARSRARKSEKPRVHLFLDMDDQPKMKTQAYSEVWADHRAMRQPVTGAVPRGDRVLRTDDHYYRGEVTVDGETTWATGYPAQVEVTEEFVLRGQERFNIFCAPCHGLAGGGNGLVTKRAEALGSAWVPPASLYSEPIRRRELGHLYNTIANGVQRETGYTMQPYRAQISVRDRWAIVAYIRALQLSQAASFEQLPDAQQNRLEQLR